MLLELSWTVEGRSRFILIGQTLALLYSGWSAWLSREEILRGDDVFLAWGWAWLSGPGLLISFVMPRFFEIMTAAVVLFVGFVWCLVMAIWENIRFVLRRYFNADIGDWLA